VADRIFCGHEWPAQLHTAKVAAVHEKKMILPPEQAIGILDDDRIRQRRTQNASRGRRGRFVRVVQQLACEVFERPAVIWLIRQSLRLDILRSSLAFRTGCSHSVVMHTYT